METDLPLLTNASYTNTRCSTGQVSIATEVANPEEKKADHLVPSLGLPSTTHSKDVRFLWVTLYILVFFKLWSVDSYWSTHKVLEADYHHPVFHIERKH